MVNVNESANESAVIGIESVSENVQSACGLCREESASGIENANESASEQSGCPSPVEASVMQGVTASEIANANETCVADASTGEVTAIGTETANGSESESAKRNENDDGDSSGRSDWSVVQTARRS